MPKFSKSFPLASISACSAAYVSFFASSISCINSAQPSLPSTIPPALSCKFATFSSNCNSFFLSKGTDSISFCSSIVKSVNFLPLGLTISKTKASALLVCVAVDSLLFAGCLELYLARISILFLSVSFHFMIFEVATDII